MARTKPYRFGQRRLPNLVMSLKPSKERTLHSLSEFLELLQDFHERSRLAKSTMIPWFRGQRVAEWPLVPSLYRPPWDPRRERELLRDFKLHAVRLVDVPLSHDLEWLAVMQHHRVPTRLLDWSENALAALHFAVEDLERDDEDAAVWILDAWSLNEAAGLGQTVPIGTDPALVKYLVPEKSRDARTPIAVRMPRLSARSLAQRGAFTLHGSNRRGLAEQIADPALPARYRSVELHKIRIDRNSKSAIREQLRACGVTRFALFPELDGLAEELKFVYGPKKQDSAPRIASRSA